MENAGKASRDLWANNSIGEVNFEPAKYTEDDVPEMPIVIQGTALPDHEYTNCIAREEFVSTFVENKENAEIIQDIPGPSKVSLQTPRQSKVLQPIRARKRKINVHRQGLSYLEQYDKSQLEIKNKELILEERRIALEEKKVALDEKKFELHDFETRKKMEILEKRLATDEEQRKDMKKNIDRQDKIIETLLLQLQK